MFSMKMHHFIDLSIAKRRRQRKKYFEINCWQLLNLREWCLWYKIYVCFFYVCLSPRPVSLGGCVTVGGDTKSKGYKSAHVDRLAVSSNMKLFDARKFVGSMHPECRCGETVKKWKVHRRHWQPPQRRKQKSISIKKTFAYIYFVGAPLWSRLQSSGNRRSRFSWSPITRHRTRSQRSMHSRHTAWHSISCRSDRNAIN